MESVQATPKYDLVKKRFMSATSNEESISPLIKVRPCCHTVTAFELSVVNISVSGFAKVGT